MKSLTTYIAILISVNLMAQTDGLVNDSKGYISSNVKIFEPNPVYRNESDIINIYFQNALQSFPDCKLDTCSLTRLLIENAVTSYEDTQDSYRYEIRRCMIYSLFAMSVPPDKSNLFLGLAEQSLINSNDQLDFRNNEAYTGILILQLLVKDTDETLMPYEIGAIKEKYVKLRTLIPEQIFDQGFQIIESFEQKYQ